jgi:FKBP-type peptidyl-prolyl cis-trans isomerase
VATPRSQRIGIWIIAIVMAVGTIGSFIVIVLSTMNGKNDQARLTELMSQYEAEVTAYKGKVSAQNTQLSAEYYDEVNAYSSRPAAFDAASVTELKTEDLVVGDGDQITADSSFVAFYIGWNPSGVVFDSSIENGALKAPFAVSPGGVIQGWTEGVTGMKEGGVRELTIPAAKAYAETGSGDNIPPNTPLKFIIFIPKQEKYTQPEPSNELVRLYDQSR